MSWSWIPKDSQCNAHKKLKPSYSPTLYAVDLTLASAIFSASALNLEGVALLACLQTTSKAEKESATYDHRLVASVRSNQGKQ